MLSRANGASCANAPLPATAARPMIRADGAALSLRIVCALFVRGLRELGLVLVARNILWKQWHGVDRFFGEWLGPEILVLQHLFSATPSRRVEDQQFVQEVDRLLCGVVALCAEY